MSYCTDWRSPGDIWVKTSDGWHRLLDLQDDPAPMDIDEPVTDDIEGDEECQEGAVGGAEVSLSDDDCDEEFPANGLDNCSNMSNLMERQPLNTNKNGDEKITNGTDNQIIRPMTPSSNPKQRISELSGNRNTKQTFKDILQSRSTQIQIAYENKHTEHEQVLDIPIREKPDQPHIFLMRGNSREKKIRIGLTDAFRKLDLYNKAKSVRHFRYICKVLKLIFKHKFGDLGGTGQKGIFTLLECALSYVLSTQSQMKMFKEILQNGSEAMVKGKDHHFVSPKLWSQHTTTINKMMNQLNSIHFKEYAFGDKTHFTELADGCVYKILHCLSDHQDVVNTGYIDSRFLSLSKSVALWRDLCHYHFTNLMIETQIVAMPHICLNEMTQEHWEQVYRKLYQKYGPRVEYGDMLELCCKCNALHWKSLGHPCLIPDKDLKEETIPVDPKRCVELLMGKWQEIPTKILSGLTSQREHLFY